MKYTHRLKSKDCELETLQDRYKQVVMEKDSIAREYSEYKDQKTIEFNKLNMSHKEELKELYANFNSFNTSNKDKDNEAHRDQMDMKYYQAEIDSLRKQVLDLSTSNIATKSEKEIQLTELNSQKTILFKEIEDERVKRELIEKENIQLASALKSIQSELSTLRAKYGSAIEDMANYKSENEILLFELNHKQDEFSMFKEEMKRLRGYIDDRENEANKMIKESEDKFMAYLNQEKKEKTDYQAQIEELNAQYHQLKINYNDIYDSSKKEKEETERNYYQLFEEKKLMIQRQNELQNEMSIIKSEYEKKARSLAFYEQEYLLLDQRYRDLSNASSEKEVQIKTLKKQVYDTEKEIENLNAYTDKLKHENKTMANSDINKKYKELIRKKRHYKEKCKKCNESIAMIIKKLSPNDKKDLGFNSDLFKDISQSEDSVA